MAGESKSIGIRDVAKAAGVSTTTVSHALNDKGRMPDATRERVRRIAEELNYRPNVSARHLTGARTGVLGVTIVDAPGAESLFGTDYAYYTSLISSASAAAMERGYALVLTPYSRGLGPRSGIATDGAIVVDPVDGDPILSELIDAGIPVVTCGRGLGQKVMPPWVDNDHRSGIVKLLDEMNSSGAERITLLTSPLGISYTVDIEWSYRQWCAEHGVEPRIEVAANLMDESSGYEVVKRILEGDPRPDGIYAITDRLAYGAVLACRSAGLDVPGDVIVGMVETGNGAPQPTSAPMPALNLAPERIGIEAANLLADLVEGVEREVTGIVVETRISSVGPVSADKWVAELVDEPGS
jgi:DNA-binding LacI/PurR family transcriptional regulator